MSSSQSERAEREYLEGQRYEDKFPDDEARAYELAEEFCLRAAVVRPCRPCVERAKALMTACEGL